MRHISNGMAAAAVVVLLLAGAAGAADPPGELITTCPVDSVLSGTGCMDKYKASVWRVPDPTTANSQLVGTIKSGVATVADLIAGGATLLGNYAPCTPSGQNCTDIYAVSLPGLEPSVGTTWFQAQQACSNAGKRLPSNAEWQGAVAGTPDPGPDNGTTDCNTGSVFDTVDNGSRSGCVSSDGAFDMVGNLFEWVADWVPRSTDCGAWSAGVSPTGDEQCLAGAATTGPPGALVRGGSWRDRSTAGPLWVLGSLWPSGGFDKVGFRCVGTAIVTPAGPDLVETAVTLNPSAPVRTPGTTFSVTDTVQNAGTARSGPSTTRYYLSLDGVKSTGDTLLSGTHSAHGMDAGASHTATVTVTIPAATPLNTYFLLACADDLKTVAESNETNNCTATATAAVTVARPDLVDTAATTNPPMPVRAPGTTFSVTDTVRNLQSAPAGPSTTRYYLSLDGVKNAGDTLLTGSRGVPALAAGASHSGTVTVTIPAATPLDTYVLLACADDLNAVVETNEANNCVASATATVTVTRPDLVETTVSAPPATKARGSSFPVTDTVQNAGAVASGSSTTRYYLSLDGVKSAGDTLLTGSRGIPALAAGASHSGTVTVTIPAATPLNTYFLLACADGPATVVETDETNNCKPSSTTVTVTTP